MQAVGVRPTRGDFGLPDACIIKPGDPWASTLYYRMAKFGRDRMPHIGAERPDEKPRCVRRKAREQCRSRATRRKKQGREERRKRRVNIKVIPLEDGSERRRKDDAPLFASER